jgi:glyoxylase-like metal-dependent hydrolase (beta-lactamase superfamily II)
MVEHLSSKQSDEDRLPIHNPRGFARFFLERMGCSPMQSGYLPELDGAIIIPSKYSSAVLFPLDADEKKFGLIDAGATKNAKEIIDVLEYKDRTVDDVEEILVTHPHEDHVKGIGKFPKARIYVGPGGREVLMGKAKTQGLLPKLAGHPRYVPEDRWDNINELEDGETITIGQHTIQSYNVPGHTDDTEVYYFNKQQILFAGDATTFDNDGNAVKPPWFLSHDNDEGVRSLGRLVRRFEEKKIVVKTVIPSHSGSGTIDQIKTLAQH